MSIDAPVTAASRPTQREWEVLLPTASKVGKADLTLAPRPASLDGLTVGLLWNAKANGDVALRRAGEAILERFPTAQTRFYSGRIHCGEELLAQVAEECDVVIGCTADCGSCTSWMTHDCIQLERAGVPTVIIGSRGFERNIEASARAFGLANTPYVLVAKVYNSLTTEEARSQTEPVLDQVIHRLTVDPETAGDEGSATGAALEPAGLYVAGLDGLEAFNRDFLSRDWGDGYPLIPPTSDRVAPLVAAMGGDPEALVCLMPPGNGHATVGKVAVNGAMAGARPAEMPVVLAALRALANLKNPMGRVGLMATGAQAPMFMVNGPIAAELGINGKRCCFGPGRQNEANIRIGRAILLCLKNLGRWYPGVMDMDTLGSPRKFNFLFAENEDESPWEPYHVSAGFAATDSVVSLFLTSGEWDVALQGFVDAQNLAYSLAGKFTGAIQTTYLHDFVVNESEDGRLVVLAPEHARPLAEGGFSKSDFLTFMHENVLESAASMIEPLRKLYRDGKIKPQYRALFELSPEELAGRVLPAVERPELWQVVVAGTNRARDMLLPLQCLSVSERVS